MNTDLNQIYTAVLGGDLKLAVDTTRAAVEEGVSPNDIINGYMIKAMEEKNDGLFDYDGTEEPTWAK